MLNVIMRIAIIGYSGSGKSTLCRFYSKIFFDERMEKTDFILVMLFNRFNLLWRVWKRCKKYKGQSRPDMTVGCDEKLDFEFIRWILFVGDRPFFRQLAA